MVGREHSEGLSADYPGVVQLTWAEILAFIWDRLHRYRRQKTQVNQWDEQGRTIKRLADTVVFLQDGRVTFFGSWPDFENSPDPFLQDFLKQDQLIPALDVTL